MPIQSPLPTSLPKECGKAAQIFSSFANIIPGELLREAKGFAILVIAKAGFLFSARAGSGVVVVKLQDGTWSAPSAIGTGGLGVGGQAGAELSEFVIILNSRAAVSSFMSSGSVNLGGNLSVAVGPLGRNAEATGSLNKFATMYSYSRTKGLFGGASLEGSVIFERADANDRAYAGYLENKSWDYADGGRADRDRDSNSEAGDEDEDDFDRDHYRNSGVGESGGSGRRKSSRWRPGSSKGSGGGSGKVTARMILSGQIPPPPWASGLINALDRGAGTAFDRDWINDEPADLEERRNRGYSFGSEHASRSSASAAHRDSGDSGYGKSSGTSPRDRITAQAKGRLRGYSLGSFGRKSSNNSSSGAAGGGDFGRRDRRNTSASAGAGSRYGDPASDEDGENPYRDVPEDEEDIFASADPGYAARERERDRASGFSTGDYDVRGDVPPSPSESTASAGSRGQKLAEYLKRPVLSGRKSTSSARDIRGGGSPLSLGRSKSQRSREATLSKYGYGGDDDREVVTDTNSKPSPFTDRFSFITEGSRFDFDRFRNKGSTDNSRSSSPVSRPGAGSRTPSFGGRDRKENRKSSLLGAATNVLSRPLGKRSVTAPMPRRRYTNERDEDEEADYRRRRREEESDEEDGRADRGSQGDYFDFTRRSAGGSDRRSPAAQSYHDDDDDDEDSDRPAQIAIHRNPFEDSAAGNGSSAKGTQPQDLLDHLDEDDQNIVSSSSFSDVEVPRHRLEALYLNKDRDADSRSIRSIDSNTEFTFGNKAMKLKMVSNDFSGRDAAGHPSAVIGNGGAKIWRMATFDFEGAESGDLSFKTGDIIEILNMDDPDWYLGRLGMQEGIVPVNRTRAYRG